MEDALPKAAAEPLYRRDSAFDESQVGGWKLRLASFLATLYPVTAFVVEDVAAETRKDQRRWNGSFSPLEVGKRWFYAELEKIAPVILIPGHETKRMRDALGLPKARKKSAENFLAHCVDLWVLAASAFGGTIPDNTQIVRVAPLRFRRRSLHLRQPAKGGCGGDTVGL